MPSGLLRRDLLLFCRRTFIILITTVAAASSAIAALHKTPPASPLFIHYDSGGQIGSYLSKYNAIRMSGQHVVIDGTCASACTLLLGSVPRNRICVTKNAVLAFHSAWSRSLTGVHASRPGTLYVGALSGRRAPLDFTTRWAALGDDLYALAEGRHAGFRSAADRRAPVSLSLDTIRIFGCAE
jgi:hypothetical protein